MTTVISQEEIFNAERYELPIPKIGRYKADKLIISFSGQIEIDRTSETDLAFINGLEFLSDVDLKVTATVVKSGFAGSPGKDDSPEQTGYGVGLRVHSVEVA